MLREIDAMHLTASYIYIAKSSQVINLHMNDRGNKRFVDLLHFTN